MVLLALADHVNVDDDTNVCWPSVRLLARKTGSSRSTVQRAIRELRALGLVRVVRRYRANRSQSSNGYRVMLSELQRRELAAAQAKAQAEIEELDALFESAYPSVAVPVPGPGTGPDAEGSVGVPAEGSVGVPAASGTVQSEGLNIEDLQAGGGCQPDTGGVSHRHPPGVSGPVGPNRQGTVMGEAARERATATTPDTVWSSTARPAPEPVASVDAPQEPSTRTSEPRLDESPNESGEQPVIVDDTTGLDAQRPEPTPPPAAAGAAAPAVSDLVTTAAAQAQTPPAPTATVLEPDPARRETWRCARHLAVPDPHDRPCGGCGAVRRRMQAQAAQQATEAAQKRSEAAQHARQRIAGCTECDDYGHVIDPDDPAGGPCYPALFCDHSTPAATRAARQTQRLAAQAAITQQTYQRSPATLEFLAQVRAGLPQRDLRRARRNPKAWR